MPRLGLARWALWRSCAGMKLRPLCTAACVLAMMVGCDEREPVVDTQTAATVTAQEQDKANLERDIADLAKGKDSRNAKDMAAYDKAVSTLSRRGSAIENEIIDHLRRAGDWSVRMGLVEVLQSIGGKACIEHLISVCDDSEPLVALRANTTLELLTGTRVIPETGQQSTSGLPPVPVRPDADLAMDAELLLWTAWHKEHGTALRAAWLAWWKDNEDRAIIR